MVGKTLAHYEIQEQIGAGGMGEVYRARDSKLDRHVAIKVIPEILGQDAERLSRFRREAKLLAALNHPHVATLHGLEESNGQQFLVMELVEGEDLSARIRRGPIAVKEALQIAGEVAAALQAAHEQDIVHRDLKPANIKITPDDKVKVLDFGLAKALESNGADPRISQSPTLAASMGTMGGVILGTAAYMSPEQARGKPIDKRTDVWALGCVLYEMLTGQTAFPGETVSDTIAKILEREPDWDALPANVPPVIQVLLRRCLQKDPKKRLQDVGDLRIQLEEVTSGVSDSWVSAVSPAGELTPSHRRTMPWMVATAVAGVAAIVFAIAYFRGTGQEMQTVRSVIPPAENTTVISTGDYAGPVAISPDGRMVAYVASEEAGQQLLWVRELSAVAPRAISGTEGATFPFWSPDSRSLGYFGDGRLKRVDLAGGLPISLCDASNGRGGTWNADGTILFSPDFRMALFSIHSSGGAPVKVTTLDRNRHTTHRWPHFMPDGKHFIYIAANHDVTRAENNTIFFGSLDSDEYKPLMRSNTSAIYASGHLLFLRDNTLMAARFDPGSGELTTDPAPLPDKVAHDPTTWFSAISASRNGTLVYHSGAGSSSSMRLAFFDRTGREIEALEATDSYYAFRLSPHGDRLAVSAGMTSVDIWTIDIERRIRARMTFDPIPDVAPVWSPDQAYIAFSRIALGAPQSDNTIYRVPADGGNEEVVYKSEKEVWITDWAPDGRHLLISTGTYVGDSSDVWILPLSGEKANEPYPLVKTSFYEDGGKFSPDGKWIAYVSDESNENHVYVTPFVEPGSGVDEGPLRKWQVSIQGGVEPRWRRDGKELFFISNDGALMSAEVEARGERFFVGQVEPLFSVNLWNLGRIGYDATADGERFLINTFSSAAESPMMLVTHWLSEKD